MITSQPSLRSSMWAPCLLFFIFLASFSVQAQDTTLNQYTGKYLFPEGSDPASADVTFDGQNLIIAATQGRAILTRVSGDSFSMSQYDGKVEFLRDSSKAVTGIKVIIEAANMNVEGKRVVDGSSNDNKEDKGKALNRNSRPLREKEDDTALQG